MKKRSFLGLLSSLTGLVPVARGAITVQATLPNVVVTDFKTGGQAGLASLQNGHRGVFLLVDSAWTEARSWLARSVHSANAATLEQVIVVVVLRTQNAKLDGLGLAEIAGARIYVDKEGKLLKTGDVKVLPAVLGVGADGRVKAHLSGLTASTVDVNAFSLHLAQYANNP
jgi:hypothetical protein